MTFEQLQEKVNKELAEYKAICAKSDRLKTLEAKFFVYNQAKYCADQLMELAKRIRENAHLEAFEHSVRVTSDVLRDMLAWGQPLASALFSFQLRERITDPIEHFYGVSFSALGIYPIVIDKTDGKECFVLYNPRRFSYARGYNESQERFTIMKDSEYLPAVPATEFDSRFTFKK